MGSGKKNKRRLDPLTDWELAAINVLVALDREKEMDVKASRENMLALMQALDLGELEAALHDEGFIKTKRLLLAMLHGERIEVTDPPTFNARQEIFAAAQVIYNQAAARGLWTLHPEIRQAIEEQA